ncbi:hypothetical protein LEN26_006152 [Aphanomyces euteiches]|nr:hypothetical protein LEN26_006152 [Aphanomyces euteiches]
MTTTIESLDAFTGLLVQEHLKFHGMHDTLRAMVQELAAKKMPPPCPDVWYEMASTLALTGLVHDCHQAASTLTALLRFAVSERRKILHARKPTLVCMSLKQPSATRRLSESASTPALTRPKSAIVVASPKVERLEKSNQEDDDEEDSIKPVKKEAPRMTKGVLGRKHGDKRGLPRLLVRDLHLEDGGSREITPPPPSTSSTAPVHSPKWLPDENQQLRQVRRGLVHVQQELQIQDTLDKYRKHHKLGEIAPPLPRDLVRMPCKLCLASFPKHNLSHQVPYKAIMDVRRKWNKELEELNPTMAKPPTCYDLVRVCVFCMQFLERADEYRPVDTPCITPPVVALVSLRDRSMDDKKRNDPYACDPILDDDEMVEMDIAAVDDVERNTVGGQIGRNIRYNMQNANTVRNLSQGEWGVIHTKQKVTGSLRKVRSIAQVEDRPSTMKHLLIEATRRASLEENSLRRHTIEERSSTHHEV